MMGNGCKQSFLWNRKPESLKTSIKAMPDVPLIPKIWLEGISFTGLTLYICTFVIQLRLAMFIIMLLNLCRLFQGSKMTMKGAKTKNLQTRTSKMYHTGSLCTEKYSFSTEQMLWNGNHDILRFQLCKYLAYLWWTTRVQRKEHWTLPIWHSSERIFIESCSLRSVVVG